jgi:hypothetical protein
MPNQNRRLLLEIDVEIREINRQTINTAIPDMMSLKDLNPVIKLVAKARAKYLQAFFALASATGKDLPTDEAITDLASHRRCYEELVKGMQALEIAIEREYLEVGGKLLKTHDHRS